ncbi:hypothetical protein [Pontibacter sp. HSC-36F09]|uniref:hypothetical protein n=1 Tax=Pontibacter sp. HSC-36F09 TaxID=2910966 RepID=UPI00209FC243|nr:hypothetical protein [Pontibacter sp. HSC-36F09]MCP2045418.1 hypothetical protein [Pontibacter sp. HSC-36F09]
MNTNRFLPRHKAAELLQYILSSDTKTVYDPEKHRLTLLDEMGTEQVHFRLPISLPYTGAGIAEDRKVHYILLLIQAGHCAMGYFEDGQCLNHKVFRSYMVRQKQGKSQIKYLKTKGKSRAGSRVRLGETAEFFENINGRLQDYFQEHRIDRIAMSCSKTLLPYLYTSTIPTPFDKRDPRLFRIPKHIHTPIYEVLLDANRFLQRGELIALTEAGFAAIPALEDFMLHHLNADDAQDGPETFEETADEVYVTDEWDDEDDVSFDEADEEDDIVEWD